MVDSAKGIRGMVGVKNLSALTVEHNSLNHVGILKSVNVDDSKIGFKRKEYKSTAKPNVVKTISESSIAKGKNNISAADVTKFMEIKGLVKAKVITPKEDSMRLAVEN